MKFSIEELRPTRNGMTISRDSKLGNSTKVTYFSMGKDTSISQESYDRMTMYIGAFGWGEFIIGEEPKTIKLQPDELLIVHYVECRHLTELCIQKLYVQERILI